MWNRIALAAGLLLLVALVAAFWRERLPTIRLSPGHELRVLSVSAGTRHSFSRETGWRRFAAENLPAKYATQLGAPRNELVRPHGSLVVWLTETDARNDRWTEPKIASAFVEYGSNRWVEGTVAIVASNVVQLEFPVYPRANAEINMRVLEQGQQALFKIRNPRIGKVVKWEALTLPQTNRTATTVIELRQTTGGSLSLFARDADGSAAGWMQWRVEVEDTAKNWEELVVNGSRLHGLERKIYEPGPLKLTVHANEFLSAGYVTNRADGIIQQMEIIPRAQRLGMDKLFFLGHAEYLFINGEPRVCAGDLLGSHVVMNTTNSAAGWHVHLANSRPGLVMIYPPNAPVERFDARLRERTGRGNGGAIFYPHRTVNEARGLKPPRLLRQLETPAFTTTNAIEAEIIARHRPVTFIIARGP